MERRAIRTEVDLLVVRVGLEGFGDTCEAAVSKWKLRRFELSFLELLTENGLMRSNESFGEQLRSIGRDMEAIDLHPAMRHVRTCCDRLQERWEAASDGEHLQEDLEGLWPMWKLAEQQQQGCAGQTASMLFLVRRALCDVRN
jgi:hypothetical protein